MTRLIDDPYSQVEDTIRHLIHDSRFTSELGKEIRKVGGAERAILAMRQEFFPSTPSRVHKQGGRVRNARHTFGPLPPDHYRVNLTYAPLPSKRQLEKEFSKDGVSDLFDGREWKKHASCVGMSETPGEKTFLVKDFECQMEDEEAIAWGQKNGYRPATHQEAYEFAKAHPKLQRQVWIAALGSSALFGDGNRYVAVLDAVVGRRILDDDRCADTSSPTRRFLFVRK